MAVFKIITPHGLSMPLTNNEHFDILDIDGQTQFDTNVNSASNSLADGDTVNSVSTIPRSIIITLWLKGNVEEAKRYIFKHCKPKQQHRIVWEQNGRNLEIAGHFEAASIPRWQNGIACVLTFHCSQPYWEDVDEIVREISETIPLHYFTTAIDDMLFFDDSGIVMGEIDTARTRTYYNEGDVAVGVEIVINALATVTNPVLYASPDVFIGVGNTTMNAGDTIVITTQRGNKDIKLNGVSIIDRIRIGSTWVQLETGENTYSIDSDDAAIDNMYFEIKYRQRYV